MFRRIKRWALAIALASNHLVNALIGGDPNMTVSARAGYARDKGSKFAAGTCHVLDWLDPRDGDAPQGDHCDIARENNRSGRRK